MKLDLYNQLGEVTEKVELPDEIFGLKVDHDLLHQAITAQRANGRKVLAHTKDRSEVKGGGKKPWKQKGTGRARHGSIRSPLWRHGGVTFGPSKNRNFSQKINKKTKRKALFMALSSKVADKQILVLNELNLAEAKTKTLDKIVKNLSAKFENYRLSKNKKDGLLLILPSHDKFIERTARNLSFAKTLEAKSLNVADILSYKFLLLIKGSIPVIKETYKL